MTIEAKIIADTTSPHGIRLTTFQLKYPRFIHSEFMTHRVFSRNASSSRAIPVAKMIDQVREDYARPVHWGKNQPGMQADVELEEPNMVRVKSLWREAAFAAIEIAEKMNAEGAHKQIVNRILEPFQHIHVIVTSTEWDNFYALRAHKDAQPEIRELAREMKAAHWWSKPTVLKPGEWHLPYVKPEEYGQYDLESLKRFSAARCARVSYLNHDGSSPDPKKDLDLFERLVGSDPKHCSPVEHQATPYEDPTFWGGNFRGWKQFRQEIEGDLS